MGLRPVVQMGLRPVVQMGLRPVVHLGDLSRTTLQLHWNYYFVVRK